MPTRLLRIASRGSPLALWQAHFVRDRLQELHAGLTVEIVEIVSTGDAVRDRPLAEVGTVGVFTKEIQKAVLDRRADIAVHSLKDLPTERSDELVLAAVPKRGPVADALLSVLYPSLEELPTGACVATSSLRRKALLLRKKPDLTVVDVRGNVDTRIQKLRDGQFDALILAQAGLERLGRSDEIKGELSPQEFIPAVSQGALGIEARIDDAQTIEVLASLNDSATHACVLAERAFLRELKGGCSLPVGALAQLSDDRLSLHGIVLSPDGENWLEESAESSATEPEEMGQGLARLLLSRGADRILRGTY